MFLLLLAQFGFDGGLGFFNMEDAWWVSVRLAPEVGIGPVGFGLDIPIRVNVQTWELRGEDWDSPADWVGKIRYIRLGYEHSPFYLRGGVLDHLTMGYGFIMDNYNNSIDENERRIGLLFRSDLKRFGADFVWSNLASVDIVGIRPYIRPIKFFADIPIISNVDVGFAWMRDFDMDLTFLGLDAGLPLNLTSMLSITPCASIAKILTYGGGKAYGIRASISLPIQILKLSFKFERRDMTSQFIPSYFDAFYEVNKEEKKETLKATDNPVHGWFGDLYATVMENLTVGGGYEWYDEWETGKLHLVLDATRAFENLPFKLIYDNNSVSSLSDITFENDEDIMYTLIARYRLLPHVYVTLTVQQTYAYNDSIDTYEPLRTFGVSGDIDF